MSIKQKRRIKYLTFTLAPALLIAVMILVPAMSLGQAPVPAEYLTCTECHNDTTLLTGKETAWEESLHGTGTAFLRGTSASCAGCHSGGGFSAMVAAGQEPNTVPAGDPTPTRQSCRACHQIHESYTGVDWALETTAAVNLYAIPGKTFDGGKGNLCTKCHQPRRAAPVAVDGVVTGINSHWGPHHGPQSSMMIGTGGAGAAGEGTPSGHYSTVTDTCVACHMGSNDTHSFTPSVSACTGCHAGATNFDINGVQTTVQGKLNQLKTLLLNTGALACSVDEEGVEECHPNVTQAPENEAYALYNWVYIAREDGSKGVHNAAYTNALLDTSIAAFTCDGQPVLGISLDAAFWASYNDYTAGLLSVRSRISNNGGTNAFNVNMTYASASNGVTPATSMPASVGNIATGASALVTVQYNVPTGVYYFRATNGATAENNCGTTYTYGTQPPSP